MVIIEEWSLNGKFMRIWHGGQVTHVKSVWFSAEEVYATCPRLWIMFRHMEATDASLPSKHVVFIIFIKKRCPNTVASISMAELYVRDLFESRILPNYAAFSSISELHVQDLFESRFLNLRPIVPERNGRTMQLLRAYLSYNYKCRSFLSPDFWIVGQLYPL